MSLIIALGTNIGDKNKNLKNAIKFLDNEFGTHIAKSRIYDSQAVGVTDQPSFFNMVIEYNSPSMTPHEALNICLEIENKMGRKRIKKWGPRNIDIDILFMDDYKINDDTLTLPHPFINERSFVVLPLQELPCFEKLSKSFRFAKSFDNTAVPII